MPLDLSSSPQYLKGIGPRRAKIFEGLGIHTVEDILYYFPRRYEDRSHLSLIRDICVGSVATIEVEVLSQKSRRSFARRFDLLEVHVGDTSGRLAAVWFNQSYLKDHFKTGARILLHGKVELYKDRLQMSSPEFELVDTPEEAQEARRIVPVYRLPQGISQKVFRKLVKGVLDKFCVSLAETLTFDIRQRRGLLNIAQSLRHIHFPGDEGSRANAFQRLCFEEFFLYQLPLLLRKLRKKEKKGIVFEASDELAQEFLDSLPFELTLSQKMVLEEIKADLRSGRPMQRLLQGDVGSGKTVVATVAAFLAAACGYQTAFLVPTEILASQHYEKIREQLEGYGRKVRSRGAKIKIRTALLTSSLGEKEKQRLREEIAQGNWDIVIGTHALLQEEMEFRHLGLIVIDEQHKFGVSQRAFLPQKGVNPHILIMTATPIPRTLSLTLYGDLDISLLRELPRGRPQIRTMSYKHDDREAAYEFLRGRISQGQQAFVVYPLIEESPQLMLRSAKAMYKEFKERVFKDLRVGLIHGRLDREEQQGVMRRFREGDLDILVATTVLEVGIDVPNATVMLIEHADRFGLSQLHQMRGRVGRGTLESFCLLVADPATEEARQRLEALVSFSDGFRIAEEDLRIRGPGEFFGERQHGLAELRIADPLRQLHILKAAREDAVRVITGDPLLKERVHREIRRQLHRRFPGFERFIEVG